MIRVKHKGDFSKTIKFLGNARRSVDAVDLKKYGEQGVAALAAATPVDTGLTASSWYYEITKTGDTTSISFHNSNVQNNVQIAVLLQYGHGTKNGGWVQGKDYINPAIQPIFDEIADNAWREVTKS